jgi:cytochrome c biogenesis protein CcmG/thiol:disulfide interchange protein DsbE
VAVVVVVLVAAVVGAVLLTGGGGKTAAKPGHPGPAAAAFELPNLEESKSSVSLASYRGKPVLLNFWATWCTPCVQEMPMLEAAYRRSGTKVAFLGVDRQDYRPDAQAFVNRTHVTYASAYDRDGTLDERYRLRGMPTSVFIDAEGRVVNQVTGPLTRAQLDDGLKALTAPGA